MALTKTVATTNTGSRPKSVRNPNAAAIRTGDVIAATSTVPGLDVAHTGFAYWVGDELHLLHAPLVGSTVVLSERPLAQRIREISGQDGIMVSRPAEAWFSSPR